MAEDIIGVVCSGRGSNLQSIIEATRTGQVAAPIGVVIADNPRAMALTRAADAGIDHVCVDFRSFATRQDFEAAMLAELRRRGVTLLVLAGFMKVLTPYFIREFGHPIMNIHPALLPSFPGAHAHRDVLAYGVKVSGVTVHFVDEGTDTGPIILQAAVPVLDGDDEDSLAARVLVEEHKVYPRAIALHLNGRLRVDGRIVRIAQEAEP